MAWLTIDQKREEISRVYPADWWRMKVYGMPYHQVAAIYNRMLASGDIKDPDKKPDVKPTILEKRFNVKKSDKRFEPAIGEQIKFDI